MTFQSSIARSLKMARFTQRSNLKEYQYTTTDGEVRYLLAPDSEHAAWAAAELSNGTNNVLDVRLCDEW